MPTNMIQALVGQYYKKIERLISPLKNYGISYFSWQTVSNEGKWSIVGNRLDWLEYSAHNRFYMNDPSLIHPEFYSNSINYTATHKDENFQNTIIKEAMERFDLNHGLVMVEKNREGAEFAIFAAPNKNSHVINTYINNVSGLKKFVRYFKQEMVQAIDAMQEINVDIAEIKHDFLSKNKRLLSASCDLDFDQVTGQNFATKIAITKREQECLHYTLQGMTAKEIARVLQISHRTVEIHLDNIRKKYGLSHKRSFFSYGFEI